MFIDLSYPQKKSQRYENKFAFFQKYCPLLLFPPHLLYLTFYIFDILI